MTWFPIAWDENTYPHWHTVTIAEIVGDVVTSLAKVGETGMTGDVTLSAGSGIELTQTTGNIEVTATGGGGGSGISGGLSYIPAGSYASVPQGMTMPVYGGTLTADGTLYLDGRLLVG